MGSLREMGGLRGMEDGAGHTPVCEEWPLQAPVLHPAVIDVLGGGHKAQIVELAEQVVGPGVETGLGHTLGDRLAIAQPGDLDNRGEDVVHHADERVGPAQLHRSLGEDGHRWRH